MEIIVAHVRDPAPAPSTRSELPVPAALDALVSSLLEKDPGDRPGSATDVAKQLAEIDVPEGPAHWNDARAARWWQAFGTA